MITDVALLVNAMAVGVHTGRQISQTGYISMVGRLQTLHPPAAPLHSTRLCSRVCSCERLLVVVVWWSVFVVLVVVMGVDMGVVMGVDMGVVMVGR